MNNPLPIFITGTTGIAGGFAVTELNKRHYPLRIMVRKLPDSSATHLNTYIEGDLSNLPQLDIDSKNNAGIIHYACASLRGRAKKEVDIEAMKVLLNNWDKGPFIFISSLDVYGASNNPDIIDETRILSGHVNEYAAGKIACEKLLVAHAKKNGRTDYTIFRAPWIFSPSLASKNHMQSRFVSIFENDIILPGATQNEWEKFADPWVDARDLAWLVAEAITKPLGGAGNVLANSFNWHDFFETLNTVTTDKRNIVHKPLAEVPNFSAELFGNTCVFSAERIKQFYGFSPHYQLRETLTEAFTK